MSPSLTGIYRSRKHGGSGGAASRALNKALGATAVREIIQSVTQMKQTSPRSAVLPLADNRTVSGGEALGAAAKLQECPPHGTSIDRSQCLPHEDGAGASAACGVTTRDESIPTTRASSEVSRGVPSWVHSAGVSARERQVRVKLPATRRFSGGVLFRFRAPLPCALGGEKWVKCRISRGVEGSGVLCLTDARDATYVLVQPALDILSGRVPEGRSLLKKLSVKLVDTYKRINETYYQARG